MNAASPDLDPRPALRQVLIALLPGALLLFWFHGPGVLLQVLLCSLGFLGSDALARRLSGQPSPTQQSLFGLSWLGEGSGLVSAVLLGLALPAHAPWWLGLGAAAFASLAGKNLFGGVGRNPFNPAMLGYAFALLAFPVQMTQWPAAGGLLETLHAVSGSGPVDGWSQATALDLLRHNDRLTVAELAARHPQAIGGLGTRGTEWAAVGFALGGLWLLRRGVIGWQAPAGMLGALLIVSLLFWGGSGSDSNGSPLFHLFSGATLLGAFFIVTEPVSGPSGARARLLFGIGVGLLVYLIRVWGGFPDGLAFAVLLMNLGVPLLERIGGAR